MAKLKAPLFSFSASGKIADALVYFPWKGLNVVRQYVVPTNPNTTLQSTHRAYLTACVAAIHTAEAIAVLPLGETDKVAYSQKGSTYPTPRTWFNQICKFWLDCKVATKVPIVYRSVSYINTSKDDLRPQLYIEEETGSTLADGKFYLGTSPTALVHQEVHDLTAGEKVTLDPAAGFSGLTAGVKYYWQYRPDSGDGCAGADSGIYHVVAT